MIQRFIEVSFQKEGIHQYPKALTSPELSDVSFLGYPHRHIFHFYVSIEVTHNDRDIEFIQFKRELEALYNGGTLLLNHKSCEMLAEELLEYILKKYPNREVSIGVFEDDENGARLYYYKSE